MPVELTLRDKGYHLRYRIVVLLAFGTFWFVFHVVVQCIVFGDVLAEQWIGNRNMLFVSVQITVRRSMAVRGCCIRDRYNLAWLLCFRCALWLFISIFSVMIERMKYTSHA